MRDYRQKGDAPHPFKLLGAYRKRPRDGSASERG
jgi:hypothetical protein